MIETIAVIGGGVAGLCVADLLSRRYRVTLFESEPRLGGHTNTSLISRGPDVGTPVDTGFITFNEDTYPLFIQWLRQLGVATRPSDMSFGYQCQISGLCYGGHNLDTLFAQRRNLVRPDFLRLVVDIARFNLRAQRALARGDIQGTLGEWCRPFSRGFLRHYLIPLGAAIWSAPPGRLLEFPAEAYLRFFLNHGLLTPLGPPRWRTVVGGSHSYIKALERRFHGEFRRGHPVTAVRRDESGFEVECQGWQRFDAGVLAVHADQALALLSDPTEQERELLGAWRYQANQAVLHTDESMLPREEKARASWNYLRSSLEDRATLTYDMNRLQGLYTVRRYLVTINPLREIDPDLVHGRWTYHHPQYDTKSMASQAHLPGLSGVRGTYYCGSYFGFGFHEDAVRSAVQAAGLLGVNL